ncbi:hypothetical protein HYY75_08830 [bacterium]|nr:hypothetical protein [bacterium]
MKKSVSLSIFLFLLATLSSSSSAQPVSGWGTVDTRLLLIVHPAMENFDYINQRFFRPDASKMSGSKISEELEKARKESTPLLGDFKTKVAEATTGRATLFLEKDRKTRRILEPSKDDEGRTKSRINQAKKEFAFLKKESSSNDQLTSYETIPIDEKERKKLLEDIEIEFKDRIASYDLYIENLNSQINFLQEKMYSSIYLTTPETREKLKSIKDEISSLISEAAKEGNFGVVMDTSFSAKAIKKARDIFNLPLQPDYGDSLSSALFHEFSNWEKPNKVFKDAAGNDLSPYHGTGATASNKALVFKKYLEVRNYIGEELANFTPGNIFLVGGVRPLSQESYFQNTQFRSL